MKKNNNFIKIIVLLFLFFSCSFFSIKESYGIYRNTMNTTIHLSVLDPNTSYRVSFVATNGTIVGDDHIDKNVNQPIGTLPTATRNGYNFIGWYTADEPDGTKISAETLVTANVTYYAHFAKIVCKKATTRHQETCTTGGSCLSIKDSNNQNLYALNDPIYYGTIPTVNSPLPGDAYDCDVNDDGTFDAATERFYYIRDEIDGDDDIASLVHFTSFDAAGQMDSDIDRGSYVYNTAITYLPSTSLWDNPALVSFDNNKAARFIQFDDLFAACGGNSPNTVSFRTCQYFLETSRFQSSSLGRSGIWLETDTNFSGSYRIHTGSLSITTGTENTARPVIEIPYNTIEGYKERVTYNVTFNSNGGTAVADSPWIRYENQAIGSLPHTSQDGYEFLGWYDENDVRVTAETVVTGNMIVHAEWEEIIDTLEYVFRIPGTCTFNANSAITSASNDCVSTVNHTNANIDYTDNTIADFAQTANKYIDTHVALYNETNYEKDYEVGFTIVTYNGSGSAVNGIPGNSNSQATIFNAKLENKSLNYPGIVFRRNGNASKLEISETINAVKGTNSDLVFTNPVTSSDPIYVKIVRKDGVISYSVSVYNDGEMTELQDINGTSDYFEHYAWFGGGGSSVARSATTSSPTTNKFVNITLSDIYIKLESDVVVTHEVNFNGGEGATVTPFVKKDVNHGAAVGQLPTATKTGFAFDGWWTQASGGTRIDTSTVIGSDKTFYAHWKDIYLVTFYPYGGTLSIAPDNTIEVVDGETIDALPTASKSGYVFDGWYTEAQPNGTKITGNEVITADTSYHAHYKQLFGVTFLTYNGTLSYSGSLTMNQNVMEVGDGDSIDVLPTATKSNVVFDGWWTAETGGTRITGNETISANTTYHAHYKEQFSVTFLTYGGTLVYNGTLPINNNIIQVGDGDTIDELPVANKANSVFTGWWTAETGGTQITGNETISANTTYHARYSQQATVTFDGGDDPTVEITPFTSKTVAIGSLVGSLPAATRTGYTFDGWYTDDTWTTPVDPDGTVVNGDVTFVAKWTFSDYEAMIGSVGYVNFEDAFATTEVPTDGVKKTIVMLKNVALDAKINIVSGQNIELDLQNFTLSNDTTAIFGNSGTLSIKNGTMINRGPESSGANAGIINNSGGVLNISGGTLNATQTNIIVNKGTLNITGGLIQSGAPSACINNESGGVLTMSAGQIIETSTVKGQCIYNNGGTTTITGNAYLENYSQTTSGSGNTGRATIHNNAGTVHIQSGTIISKRNAAVKNNGTMYIGINDDSFDNTTPVMQGYNYGLETVANKTVNIYGGIFKGRDTSSTGTKAISNENYITYDDTKADLVHEFETINFDGSSTIFDTAYLSSLSTKYTVTLNANNGTIVDNGPNSITVNDGHAVGTLPKAEKANTEFLGWFSSTTGGEKLLPTTIIDDDVTYYARYTTTMTVCRPATTIHSSSGTNFGQLHSGSMLSPGDAYDCDVNGDGVYDATNERFYYLTDDEDRAVFIYSNNVIQSNNTVTPSCSTTGVSYGADATHGPTTAMEVLPTNSQWVNVSLYTDPRDIKNSAGTTVVSDYIYTEKAARFATLDEIKAATVSTLNGTVNELASYPFLLENTISYDASCRSNYWLETPLNSTNIERVDGSTSGKRIGNSNGTSTIRPVIEVPYTVIQDAVQMVMFDTLSPAMRNYFDNISTWSSGQTDSSHSSFDTYMTNNLDNNKCVYFTGDNRENEVDYSSGWNVYCDQPNQYDTGVTGNVNVYEYNESTGTISNSVASYVTANNGKLYNFIPNQAYYWESATDSTKYGYVKPIGERRVISIDNTTPTDAQPKHKMRNVRDLGGIKVDSDGDGTIDGTIKYGKLFRSEKIWGDENATAPYLTKLGINHELDLRASSEPVTSNEDNSLPKITSDPGNANLQVFEIIHYGIDYTSNNANYILARDATARVMYEFVNAHNNGDDTYSLIFHCRIGADRTGTLAYLLEGLLGAPDEERYRDYELTVFFGLRERTRFYYAKGNNTVKFQYMKQAIRNAGDGVTEDVETWFLKGGNTTTVKQYNSQTGEVDNITVNLPDLIDDFKDIMIDSYSGS